MKRLSSYIFAALLCITSSISANTWWDSLLVSNNPEDTYVNQFYLGPEIYHVNRKRTGGTAQNGTIYGVRGGYEHIKRYKLYWGIDALYSEGHLNGKSALGYRLKSKFIDKNIEGRFGYTLAQKDGYKLSLTPFVGAGYSTESNNYVKPSVLPVHFQLKYSYACLGFLSQMTPRCGYDIGLNFKAKYVLEIKNHVTHDPAFDSIEMLVKEEWQYRVELPMTYHYHPRFLIRLEPFYEFRHYGGHLNYPFDFFDTRLNIWGAALKFIYCFDSCW